MKKILVLLATFNGEKYIQQQIKSILSQKKVKVDILVSDDCSTDETLKILIENKKDNILNIYSNKKFGSPTKNFLHLINSAPDTYSYYAFSDQDDVWFEDKLLTAINKLDKNYDVYGSRTINVDKNLSKIGLSPLFKKKPSFENAIVQSIAGNNTMVITNDIFKKIKKLNLNDAPSLDWLIYIYTTFCGYKFYYDQNPKLYYRQHDNNVVGSNVGLKNQLKRLFYAIRGDFKGYMEKNLNLIEKFKMQGTKENLKILKKLIKYRNNWLEIAKKVVFDDLEFYRQTRYGNLMLKLAFLIKRI